MLLSHGKGGFGIKPQSLAIGLFTQSHLCEALNAERIGVCAGSHRHAAAFVAVDGCHHHLEVPGQNEGPERGLALLPCKLNGVVG